MLLAGVVMPHNVEAAGAVAANVEAGSGYAGDVIDVSFNLSGNPGVTFFEIRLPQPIGFRQWVVPHICR